MELLQTKRQRTDRACTASYLLDGAVVGCDLLPHGGGMHCDMSLPGEGIGFWWFVAMADTPAELTVSR